MFHLEIWPAIAYMCVTSKHFNGDNLIVRGSFLSLLMDRYVDGYILWRVFITFFVDRYVEGYVLGTVFLPCLWTGMLMDMFRREFSYLVYGQVC